MRGAEEGTTAQAWVQENSAVPCSHDEEFAYMQTEAWRDSYCRCGRNYQRMTLLAAPVDGNVSPAP
jgi:hypothetical protein